MRDPIAIEPGIDTTAFGVVVPDLPGCFFAGETLDKAFAGAEEAAAAWIDAAPDAGEVVPPPKSSRPNVLSLVNATKKAVECP